MKRNEAFPSNYLAQGDVPSPIQATIGEVHPVTFKSDDGDEKKVAMAFTDQRLKPMVLNNVNWMTCEEAYGEDSDSWKGKRVEIYVDPNVMFGKKRVGGLRLRIPSQNGQPSAPAPSWTLAQAITECAAVGISKDELIAHLKSKGNASYQAARDTATVKALVAAKAEQEQGFDALPEPPPGRDESEIPFSFAWVAMLILPFLGMWS